jgi:energy-coupling factor transport system permease protein
MVIFYGWAGYSSSASIAILLKLKDGFFLGILAAARWALFIGFCFLLTMTTTPSDLTWTLQVLLNPLQRIRFPVHDLSVMAGLALHFLPLLKEEAERLVKVKKIRGMAIDSGVLSERLHHIIGLIPILIQRIFHRSEMISLAMEARGYSDKKANGHETIGLWEPLSRKDFWALAVLVLYLIITWCIHRFFTTGKI